MTLLARVKGAAFDAYLGGTGLRRSLQSARRALLRQPRVITFWHRVGDPHSTLLAQALGPLLDAAEDVTLEIRVVPPPAADADPEPALRAAHALADAVWLAERHGLPFPSSPVDPGEDRVRRANAVLLVDRPPRAQIEAIVALGAGLFGDDPDALTDAVRCFGVVPGQSVRPTLEENYASLRKAGHYQGGMLHYAGEWYWGLDRLGHLLTRLADEGVVDAPTSDVPKGAPPDDLEVFFSFRSPYSYLALEQLAAWPEKLILRPVLPMVMRGFVVPREKTLYITRDAKREADRMGIPFGRLCDPVGPGAERALAVFHLAQQQQRGLEFARSSMRGIWSEAVDLTTDEGLASVAVRAGLDRDSALAAAQTDGWRVTCEQNRMALLEMGLWGVPCFRSAGRVAWGQDRIPLVFSWSD